MAGLAMPRIGLFGGTFDPPHIGHLILAGEALTNLRLDKVLWILTPQSPLKDRMDISPLEQRIELLRAALRNSPGFELSLVDVNRKPPFYALDTVNLLKEATPDAEIFYVMGGDSLKNLPSWFRSAELVRKLDGLGVHRRPGADHDIDLLDRVLPGIKEKVTYFTAPQIDISSADIRQRILEGRTYRYFLTPDVFELIQSRKYYH